MGFRAIAANDHLAFALSWLDGVVALASVVDASGDLRVASWGSVAGLRRVARLGDGRLGPPQHCAHLVRSYADAGVELLCLWPIGDSEQELERFMHEVVPLV